VGEFKKALGGFPAEELGVVTSGSFEVDGMEWGQVEDWKDSYDNAIGNFMARLVEME
jgi:phosphoribosylformylglycinamidine synthase